MITELEELGANVDKNPREVAARAAHIAEIARSGGDLETTAVAATVVARARRNLGEIDLAERAIDDAISVAARVGGDVLADAHLVAASVATFARGATLTAVHLAQAERHGSPRMRTQVNIQRAVLAKREGRLDEALALYEDALPALRLSADIVTTARVISNRGSLNVLRGDPLRALDDFAEARNLFAEAGQDFAVILVIENMAWAHVNLGDIPKALVLLDEACDAAAGHDHHLQDAAVSRAEALMTAGLFDDAIDGLQRVVEALAAERDRAGVAEALLLQAEACRLAGKSGSGALAQAAAAIFEDLGATGHLFQAQLELLRSLARDGESDVTVLDSAEQIATRLATSGQARLEVEAWQLVAEIALSLGDARRAEHAARECARTAASIPFVEHRLAAAHAAAAVDAAAGHNREALETITAALSEFDQYRRAIGSADARSGSALHASALSALGSEVAVRLDEPVRTLAWSEQRRFAVPVWMPAAVVLDVRKTSELRSVLTEIRESETRPASSGRDSEALDRRRIELETALRDDLLSSGRTTSATHRGLCFDPQRLHDHVGISIDTHGDRVLAIVVECGTARAVDLGSTDDVLRACAASARLLSARARAGDAEPPSDDLVRRQRFALDRLDQLVLEPLELADGPVIIAMPDELQRAPWSATRSLVSRSFTQVPSLSWWCETTRARPRRLDHVTTVAGPRLQFAGHEAMLVAGHYPSATQLHGDDAHRNAVIEAMRTSDTVHLAAHTRIRRDNPMWSTLELSDGPLVLHELTRRRVVASLVVLSTCESGVSAGPSGAALPGFASALLHMGARSVIASATLLPDDAMTCRVLSEVHRHLADGVGPATALAQVRADHRDTVAAQTLTVWGRG